MNYRTQRAHSQASAVFNAHLSTRDHQTDQRIAVHEHLGLESEHEANTVEDTNEGDFICLISEVCRNSYTYMYDVAMF